MKQDIILKNYIPHSIHRLSVLATWMWYSLIFYREHFDDMQYIFSI